ncbi:MAG TPA: class I SAM-dependent methyltransferase [Pyrinomonadaceae bacterium]|jgi:SAM-dependent methyltransferase|nr:class I SAM-dependent methyltransferase [Pyrinomonadaceae bacterium]
MITARQFGFGPIFGVEVEEFWVTICRSRLRYLPEMFPSHYDGETLPYSSEEFQVLASGHVIEHTDSPERYLRECMRVLAPGGFLSLEFPNRYHHTELHTQLPSFEWLPGPLRNTIMAALSSKLSPLRKDVKRRYSDILVTHLKQISVGGVNRLLKRIGGQYSVLNSIRAMPGVTRCVIRKDSSA